MSANQHQSLTIDQLSIGQTYTKNLTVTERMITVFGEATGDTNPIHHDKEAGRKSIFGRRIAQGMLTAGIIGGVFGTEFPGLGTIYLSHDLKFMSPVFIDDHLRIDLEVLEIIPAKNRVRIKTTVTNQRDKLVLTGTAMVMPPA